MQVGLRHWPVSYAPSPARARLLSTLSHRPLRVLAEQQASNNGQPADQIPIGCSRYSVSLRKPLGIVLEQDVKSGSIFVVQLKPEGSAARDGKIRVGDQLIATSGVIYTSESDYGGTAVKGGQQVVRLWVQGEAFKTVSAAIGSHPGHIPVTLELQRCDTASSTSRGAVVEGATEGGASSSGK